MKKLQGFPDTSEILTSYGWEYLKNISLDTQIVTYDSNRPKRFVSQNLKILSHFDYKGKITMCEAEDRDGFILNTLFKGLESKIEGFSESYTLKTEIIPFKGKLVSIGFNEPSKVIIKWDYKNVSKTKKLFDYFTIEIS